MSNINPATRTNRDTAINRVLNALGEPAVANPTSVTDDQRILEIDDAIDEAVKNICLQGWNFNTIREKVLEPDGSGLIALPTNALRVEVLERGSQITARGDALYNLETDTNVFTGGVRCKLILGYTYEQLSDAFRLWAIAMAANYVAERYEGEIEGLERLRQMEFEAGRHAQREDQRTRRVTRLDRARSIWMLGGPSRSRYPL